MDNKLTRLATKLALKAYKHRADIAFFGGMGLTAIGTGLFVKSTFKQVEINKRHNDIKDLTESIEDADEETKEETLKRNNRDTLKETVKNYALPVAVTVAGYGLEIYGHQSVKSDLAVASTALNGMTAAYEALKTRIIEKEGEDKWAEYANGITIDRYADIEDPNNLMDRVLFNEDNNKEPYTYLFYEPNPNFNPNKGCNKRFVLGVQAQENFKLEHKRSGIIFLHEVIEDLGENLKVELKNGISPTAGWVYDPHKTGPQIDFGLEFNDTATRRFMDELEPAVLLRFNCVDNVYDYI